ncbi:MAG TPA: peptidoglycan DD-metalloendopeptidase family protein [Candidatus Limnocylindrales bacterium]|nr:peptidoglycan DD-metalloendopeptidase family protein [Candidatus Limnocylindrales bacterium]
MARPLGEPERYPVAHVRPRAPRQGPELRRLVGPLVLVLIAGAAVLLLLSGLSDTGSMPTSSPSARPGPTGAGLSQPTPAATGSAGVATARPTSPAGPTMTPDTLSSPLPSPTGRASPTPDVSAAPSRPPNAAPASADEFDAEDGVVVDIAFPFKPGVRYRYRDNWLHERPGSPEHYNHVRLRRGELVRAHDGIDLYAPRGTPVVASFAGTVIDPAERWQPWHPERYGVAVAILSSEPQSEGYIAILSHLDVAFVEPGELVRRGEVIGLNGDSGNAEGGRAHLHYELRAPFAIEWQEADEVRLIDAFNPYHSLRAADPKRAD